MGFNGCDSLYPGRRASSCTVSGSDHSLIHPVMGEMFVYFPNSYVGGLTSRVAIFGDGAFKKVIKV